MTVIKYLHHLVEEEDAAWREPSGIVVFTSLEDAQKSKKKTN